MADNSSLPQHQRLTHATPAGKELISLPEITVPSSPKKIAGRLEFLDGLRGVAALAVFVGHFGVFFLVPYISASSPIVLRVLTALEVLLANGAFAVYIFFALSGFVIAQSASSGRASLPSRLVARYLRLTVPMTVSLIFAWSISVAFSETRLIMGNSPQADLWAAFFSIHPLPLIEAIKEGLYLVYIRGASGINPVVWTMRIELIGSCGIYIFYRFCPAHRRMTALVLVFLVNLISGGGYAYLGFSLGAILREASSRGQLTENRFSWVLLTICFAISVYAGHFLPRLDGHLLYAWAGAMVLYSVASLDLLRQLLSGAIPRYLGRISFSLYLTHLPICSFVMAYMYQQLSGSHVCRLAILFPIYSALSISVAYLMTIYVDEPLTRSLRRIKI